MGAMSAKTILGRVAEVTRPMLSWSQAIIALRPSYPFHPLKPSHLSRDTDLGSLIASIEEKLPFELRRMIYDHTLGMFKSLLNTSSTIEDCHHLLASPAQDRRPISKTFPLREILDLDRIGARVVTILGEVCLAHIGAAHGDTSQDHHDIPVANRTVSGVQVSVGSYGVVGLRVLYEDGSKSPCLGDARRKWSMTLEGNDLRGLQVYSDVGGKQV